MTGCRNANQHVTILYQGKALPYTIFNQQAHQAEVVSAKDVNQALQVAALPTSQLPTIPGAVAIPYSSQLTLVFLRQGTF